MPLTKDQQEHNERAKEFYRRVAEGGGGHFGGFTGGSGGSGGGSSGGSSGGSYSGGGSARDPFLKTVTPATAASNPERYAGANTPLGRVEVGEHGEAVFVDKQGRKTTMRNGHSVPYTPTQTIQSRVGGQRKVVSQPSKVTYFQVKQGELKEYQIEDVLRAPPPGTVAFSPARGFFTVNPRTNEYVSLTRAQAEQRILAQQKKRVVGESDAGLKLVSSLPRAKQQKGKKTANAKPPGIEVTSITTGEPTTKYSQDFESFELTPTKNAEVNFSEEWGGMPEPGKPITGVIREAQGVEESPEYTVRAKRHPTIAKIEKFLSKYSGAIQKRAKKTTRVNEVISMPKTKPKTYNIFGHKVSNAPLRWLEQQNVKMKRSEVLGFVTLPAMAVEVPQLATSLYLAPKATAKQMATQTVKEPGATFGFMAGRSLGLATVSGGLNEAGITKAKTIPPEKITGIETTAKSKLTPLKTEVIQPKNLVKSFGKGEHEITSTVTYKSLFGTKTAKVSETYPSTYYSKTWYPFELPKEGATYYPGNPFFVEGSATSEGSAVVMTGKGLYKSRTDIVSASKFKGATKVGKEELLMTGQSAARTGGVWEEMNGEWYQSGESIATGKIFSKETETTMTGGETQIPIEYPKTEIPFKSYDSFWFKSKPPKSSPFKVYKGGGTATKTMKNYPQFLEGIRQLETARGNLLKSAQESRIAQLGIEVKSTPTEVVALGAVPSLKSKNLKQQLAPSLDKLVALEQRRGSTTSVKQSQSLKKRFESALRRLPARIVKPGRSTRQVPIFTQSPLFKQGQTQGAKQAVSPAQAQRMTTPFISIPAPKVPVPAFPKAIMWPRRHNVRKAFTYWRKPTYKEKHNPFASLRRIEQSLWGKKKKSKKKKKRRK